MDLAENENLQEYDREEVIAFKALEIWMLGAIEGVVLAVLHLAKRKWWTSERKQIEAIKSIIKTELRLCENTTVKEFFTYWIEQLPSSVAGDDNMPSVPESYDYMTAARILARKALEELRAELT